MKGFHRQERRFSLTCNSSGIRRIDAARSRRGDFFTVDLFLAGLRPVHRLFWRHRPDRLLPGIFVTPTFDIDAVLRSRQQCASTNRVARRTICALVLHPLQEIINHPTRHEPLFRWVMKSKRIKWLRRTCQCESKRRNNLDQSSCAPRVRTRCAISAPS